MNFLKIIGDDDRGYYINFDLISCFGTQDFMPCGDSPAEYIILFTQVNEKWSIDFKNKKDRDNKLELICNYVAQVR